MFQILNISSYIKTYSLYIITYVAHDNPFKVQSTKDFEIIYVEFTQAFLLKLMMRILKMESENQALSIYQFNFNKL